MASSETVGNMPSKVLTTMFTGVNVGYADAGITTHAEAIELVDNTLSFAKRSGGTDRNEYTPHPALVVYDPALQCPVGGKLAVALEQQLEPVISEPGFHYLCAKETANSRGESF